MAILPPQRYGFLAELASALYIVARYGILNTFISRFFLLPLQPCTRTVLSGSDNMGALNWPSVTHRLLRRRVLGEDYAPGSHQTKPLPIPSQPSATMGTVAHSLPPKSPPSSSILAFPKYFVQRFRWRGIFHTSLGGRWRCRRL